MPKKELFTWQNYSTLYKDKNNHTLKLTLSDDDKYRVYTPIKNISPYIIDATIIYEDKYFYTHNGVNFLALYKAFIATYITKSRRRGASTISMQVVKAAFSIHSNTFSGKIKQIFYALWLEKHYNKKKILEFYFNSVSYGGNIEGVEAASQIYFHKSAKDLNLPQALSLVVIPQNPTKRNPLSNKGYKELIKARDRLYTHFKKSIKSTSLKDADTFMSMKIKFYKRSDLPYIAPHFVNYLNQNKHLSNKVKTTLDIYKQKLLEKELTKWIKQKNKVGIYNAGALLVDRKSMEVRAWVGSKDFYDSKIFGQVDAVNAKRSPGSTLKPFAYALAMDQGLIHPNSLLKDTPYHLQAYTPENYDKVFLGPLTATQALITSRNIPAVKLASKLKNPTFYQFLKSANVTKMKSPSHYGMSIVLGGMEVSVLELVKLYGLLANKGEMQDIKMFEKQKLMATKKLLSPESSYLTLDMLRQNPSVYTDNFSTHHKDRAKYAWKTGTSYAFRDAWSVGISDQYILAVWVGNFDGSSNPSFIGRVAAAPLFFNILKALNEKDVFNNKEQEENLNISKVDICVPTGMLPSKLCPKIAKGWFIPGVSPIKVSNIYREVPIDIKTGLRACKIEKGKTKMKVFEFWPSDIKTIFLMAGIEKKSPPPYVSSCVQNASQSSQPNIQSPISGIIYTLESSKVDNTYIPFTAILDSDSHKAYWYVDKSFVGLSKSNEPFFWKAKLGEYRIKVVDEKGLSSSKKIRVELAQ